MHLYRVAAAFSLNVQVAASSSSEEDLAMIQLGLANNLAALYLEVYDLSRFESCREWLGFLLMDDMPASLDLLFASTPNLRVRLSSNYIATTNMSRSPSPAA